MAVKMDEENFEEAEAQAYRAWSVTNVPSEIQSLFEDHADKLDNMIPDISPFYRLLRALREFAKSDPYTLPLTSTLPDMKSDTASYIHLQKLYKNQAEHERAVFRNILEKIEGGRDIVESDVNEFVKNAHAL